MGKLHLYAISVDEVRSWFGGAPELAGSLRAIAAESFPTPIEPQTGTRLRQLGPLFKKSLEPMKPPIGPTPIDVENLVSGRAIPPQRLEPAWQIICVWLGQLSSQKVTLDITPRLLDDLDFELVRAGLPSNLSVQRLWGREIGLSLMKPHNLQCGYSTVSHVRQTTDWMLECPDELEETSRTILQPIIDFLSSIEGESEVIGLWWLEQPI